MKTKKVSVNVNTVSDWIFWVLLHVFSFYSLMESLNDRKRGRCGGFLHVSPRTLSHSFLCLEICVGTTEVRVLSLTDAQAFPAEEHIFSVTHVPQQFAV